MIIAKPTWKDDIRDLLNKPLWIADHRRSEVVHNFVETLKIHEIDISSYQSVCRSAEKVYHFMVSQHLPNSGNHHDFWPFEALETFRLWINQGCRQTSSSAFAYNRNMQPPELPVETSKTRVDIAAMEQYEIGHYCAEIEAAMTAPLPDMQSSWQRFATCNHKWYPINIRHVPMWYRAFLLHFENETGITVPYWDWTASWMSDEFSSAPRAPKAFTDEFYIHPETGNQRPNPLRFALQNLNGSKPHDKNRGRNPMLFAPETLKPKSVERYIRQLTSLQAAMLQLCKGTELTQDKMPRPDSLVIFAQLMTQAGEWAGFDMRPASLSALDPLFLSFCANADRLLEKWLHAVPLAQIQARVPLKPFCGSSASRISETCRSGWRYTSVAQMAQSSKALDYKYGHPQSKPYQSTLNERLNTLSPTAHLTSLPAKRLSPAIAKDGKHQPLVICKNLNHLPKNCWIDIFINQPDPSPTDAHSGNMHYAGRVYSDKSTWQRILSASYPNADTAYLNASCVFEALGLDANEQPAITLLIGIASDDEHYENTLLHENAPAITAEVVWDTRCVDDPMQ